MEWLTKVLSEEYQLIGIIKQDTKGKILHYRHQKLHKDLLVKILFSQNEAYPLLKLIHHPNIPQVFDVLLENEQLIVLEEFIDGVTVADILDGDTYHEEGAKKVLSSVCDALDALHKMRIIHRDIKPENVMIGNDGQVFLIDFDAARIYKPYHSQDTQFVGTVGYAAPEQFGLAQSDFRTDIFAAGVLLNMMLTREHPSKLLYQGKLKRVIEKCTQINPEMRYQNVLALKQALK